MAIPDIFIRIFCLGDFNVNYVECTQLSQHVLNLKLIFFLVFDLGLFCFAFLFFFFFCIGRSFNIPLLSTFHKSAMFLGAEDIPLSKHSNMF